MGRESLGQFEQWVLLACLRLQGEAYAVAIADEIEERAGRRPTHAAVYVALRRLESRGLVTSQLGPPTPERGGRPKRFFEVAPDAVAQLVEARRALDRLWSGVEVEGR